MNESLSQRYFAYAKQGLLCVGACTLKIDLLKSLGTESVV